MSELATDSWQGFRANITSLLVPSVATLGVYAAALLVIPTIDNPWASFGAAVGALVVATTVAYPWFVAALAAADPAGTSPGVQPERFSDQFVASLFFWAGVLLGLRYLYGLPAAVVIVFYAFFGYAIADTPRRKALRSLGWSVYLGQGNRMRLIAIGLALAFINLLAVSPVGMGVNAATLAVSAGLVLITSNWSMVVGARLYRALEEGVPQ